MQSVRFLAAVALVCAAAGPAAAQNSRDHLTCYKITDPLKLAAKADLDNAVLGVNTACTISKAALLCAPSELQNLTAATPVLTMHGPRSTGESICYKVKCPLPFPASQQVSDEFGTRTVTKFKTSLVCSPTVAGPAFQHSGLDHYPRGLAQLAETTTTNGPTLHVRSLDGLDPATPDSAKSSTADPGGSGVLVVLQNVSDIGVRVRDDRNSTRDLDVSALRVGAALSVKGHSRDNSESLADAISVGVGASGVSSTAYFPRLARQASGAAARVATLTCAGAPAGGSSETTPGDPNWTWFSPVWPDRYETISGPTSDQAVFTWETGCVTIRPSDSSGVVYQADRLVISMDNGSSPKLFHKLHITGSGGLAAFALKEEVSH